MLTVTVAVPVTIVPSGFEAMAVIAVVPFDLAVTIPVAESIVATEPTVDSQVAALIVDVPIVTGALVRFTVVPVDVVPMTMRLAVSRVVVSVCEEGTIASEVSGSPDDEPEMVTVTVAIAVTTVPSGLEAVAVMAVVPVDFAVTTPVAASIEATEGTLDSHAAALIVEPLTVADWLVRFTVVLLEVVPMAIRLAA